MGPPGELPAQLLEERQQCRAARRDLPSGRDLGAPVRRPGRPQRVMVGEEHVDVGEQLVQRVDEPALRVALRPVAVEVLDEPGERPAEVAGDDLPRLLLAYGLLLPFGRAGVDGDVPRVDLRQVVDQRVPGDPAEVQRRVDQRGEADGGQAQGEGVLRVVLPPRHVLRHDGGPFDQVRREDQLTHDGQQSRRVGGAGMARRQRGARAVRVVPRHRAALASSARTGPPRHARAVRGRPWGRPHPRPRAWPSGSG